MESKIQEIPNKKLDIQAFKMKNDQSIKGMDPPFNLIPYNFFYLIVGRPQSGKTNLLLNFITRVKKLYYKKFDRIYLFSPSIHTINKKINLPDERIFNELDFETLQTVIDDEKEEDHKILFIFDDLVNEMKKNQKAMLTLIYNRRHIGGGASIMLVSQVFNKIPLEIRKCANVIILFHTSNKKELDSFYDDFILIERPIYDQIIRHVFKNNHNFLMYFVDYSQFFSNFNEIKF